MVSLLEKQRMIFEGIRDIPPLEELTREHEGRFIVTSPELSLYPLIKVHNVVIVNGAYFGDEGKGKITDAVAHHPDISLIARMNSGENAGHTVVHEGNKYVFHLTPSAIMIPDKISVIGPECVMDPVNYFRKEISVLRDAGINYMERLFLDNVHLVTPNHKILDFALSAPNSSTLMGMSYVHSAKVRKQGLRLDDIYTKSNKAISRLKKDLDVYEALLAKSGKEEEEIAFDLREFSKKRRIPDHLFNFLAAKDKLEFIIDLYDEKVRNNDEFPQMRNCNGLIHAKLKEGGKVLLESPQSYWLSNATGSHWSSSTSAQTHATGVLASTKINISSHPPLTINVVKTPGDSRVGRGANPSSFVSQTYFSDRNIEKLDDLGSDCEDFEDISNLFFQSIGENGIFIPKMYDEKYTLSEAMAIATAKAFKERGATTKKPRVTGVFDCVMAAAVNQAQGPYFNVSAPDRGDMMEFVGLTVGYVYFNPELSGIIESEGIKYENRSIIKIGDPYPNDTILEHCHPIIKVMPSWKDTPISASKRKAADPLPQTLQNFLGTIEDLVGCYIIGIGNGQDTKNMIYLRNNNLRQAA